MFLFSRRRHVSSASVREGVAAAVEVAGMAATITGREIGTWTTIASRDAGLIVWSAMLDHLSELEAVNQQLAASAEYGDWVDAHDILFDGPVEDSLVQIVHNAFDPERTVNVAYVSTAVCAPGQMAAAMGAGVELAEAVTKISGTPTSFGTTATGLYGGVVWLGGNADLSEMEQGMAALSADPSWVALVDRHAPSFQPGTEITWYQRLA